MGLAERLEAAAPHLVGKTCSVCSFYRGLEKRDQDAFDQWVALRNRGHSVAQLFRECQADGLLVSLAMFRLCLREHDRANYVSS